MRHAEIEDAFVRAFVERDRRERYLQLLAKPKTRAKATFALATNGQHLDSSLVNSLECTDNEALARALRRLGAPEVCYIISPDSALDTSTMELEQALDATSFGQGAILILIPDRLAYRVGEYDKQRHILEKHRRCDNF
jgi:hypothetical protein